ncbi:MAG: radical SAM protein [Gammaproteobacteria bacterium]|nr:radical SAM protein [Gammaproteobacteria bacterium]
MPTEEEKKLFGDLEKFPNTIALELTNMCNGGCLFCPRSKMTRQTGVMDFDLFKKIVDQGIEGGVETFVLHWFGETTLIKDWLKYVAYIREKDPNLTKRIGLYTNGTGLTNPTELLELRPKVIAFHIEGIDEESHNVVQPGTDWQNVTNNFFKFVEAKNSDPKYRYTTVQTHFTIGNFPRKDGTFLDTATHIQRYNELFRIEGVDDTGGVSYIPWFDNLTPVEYRSSPLRFWPVDRRGPCLYLWTALTVAWDGRITMCCKDFDLSYKDLGDLTKESVLDAWNSFERRYLRYLHLSRQVQDLPCATCYFPYFNQHGKNYGWKSFMKEFWEDAD